MTDLSKVYFGCSDANTEAERNPVKFKKVFFDPHNYMEELIFGDKFILCGRKGDGKTSYGAQIFLNADDNNIYAYQKSLNNFNNITFSKIKTYDSLGGNPYISFWKCILMIECMGMIDNYEPSIQTNEYVNVLSALYDKGLLSKDSDISTTVSKLIESDSTINIKSAFKHARKHSYYEELHGAEQIYTTIKNSIQNIYLKKRFVLIVDGLDDILNSTEFKSDIISGLIRAVDEINKIFKKETLSIKILILIRNDVLNLCRDPNLSKIIRDSGIRLSWTITDDPCDSDLIKLVEKRINEAAENNKSFTQAWSEWFPEFVGTRPSLDYVLDNIIYRPRDILQFFLEAQKDFIPGRKITPEKLNSILARYSDEYFVDAMRDELTGFFPNDAVTLLPNILSKMGTRYFYLSDFEKECKKHKEFDNIQIDSLLKSLFDSGYIGQHRPRENQDFTVFSYRNQRETFHEDHECILHRGLMRALTI